jgi:hypothetical protein
VGGGFQNRSGNWSVASGGSGNWAFGQYSSVGGGINNRIQSPNLNPPPNNATIAGGSTNEVQGTSGAIGGGFQNIIEQASSFGTIVGGANNRVVGSNATVLGGASNTAGGNNSVVLGSNAKSRTPTEAGDADGVCGCNQRHVYVDRSKSVSCPSIWRHGRRHECANESAPRRRQHRPCCTH